MKYAYLAVALLLTVSGCKEKNITTETQETPSSSTPATVAEKTAETPSEKEDALSGATNVANHTSFNGTLEVPPRKHATLTLTMGGTVESLSLLPGEFVKKGTIVATLKNPDFIDLQQQYLEACAQTEYLEKEFHRQERLSKEEAASQKKYQQSKAEYLSMKSKLDATAAQLMILGIEPAGLERSGIKPFLEIKAPIEGYVADMDINLGSYINPGDRICDIINKGDHLLCLTAYEKDLDKLATGQKIEFRVNGMPEETFEATVLSIGQTVDDVSRSLQVYAKVKEANERFRPGMYVTARIEKN